MDRGRGLCYYWESPSAEEVLPACCLAFGTTPGPEQVFRAKNDWKPAWKQLGLKVGSNVAIQGERAADTSLTYFIILLQVN